MEFIVDHKLLPAAKLKELFKRQANSTIMTTIVRNAKRRAS